MYFTKSLLKIKIHTIILVGLYDVILHKETNN